MFVYLIDDSYNYFKINIIYKPVLNFVTMSFIYNAYVFQCIHKHIFCFVGIGLVFSIKSRSASYKY